MILAPPALAGAPARQHHAPVRSIDPRPSETALRAMGDEALLRLVVSGRGHAGEAARAAARLAWGELVVRDLDRVRGLVASWRLPGHDVRVRAEDREDAAQFAAQRLLRMMDTFRGDALPQWRAALVTCVDWACRDFARAQMRRERGLGASLDAVAEEGEEALAGRMAARLAELARRAEQDGRAAREELDALERGIAGLASEDARRVLRLTMMGVPSREIGERLGLSVANVDQLRSRGIRRLRAELAS